MIEAHRISKRFGRLTAVADASFVVPDRCVCGFLGPNGAGKTTTIRMIVGALAPDGGRLAINGLDPARHGAAARRQVGYLAEESPIHPELTVEEFVAHRAALYGVPRRERRRGVDRALARCHVDGVRRRLCGQLSKGYRQRCGLAAALAHDPAVLVLDEPTSGFDPGQVLEFRALMRELAAERTVLISSHVLGEVEAVCDRAIVLQRGRVAAAGTLAEIRQGGAAAAVLVLETAAPCAEALRVLPGVLDARAERMGDGWWRVEVRTGRADPSIAEGAARAVAAAGGGIRRLEWEAPTLERVFHRLLAADEARPAEGARDATSAGGAGVVRNAGSAGNAGSAWIPGDAGNAGDSV
jgi:ABC-2 type transport system ATP-binding protein